MIRLVLRTAMRVICKVLGHRDNPKTWKCHRCNVHMPRPSPFKHPRYKTVAIKRGGKIQFAKEHRVIMENKLGRRLKPDETVHHKDHNRYNNDPSNLAILSIAEHKALHANENVPTVY